MPTQHGKMFTMGKGRGVPVNGQVESRQEAVIPYVGPTMTTAYCAKCSSALPVKSPLAWMALM